MTKIEIIRLEENFAGDFDQPVCLALGNFDGLHLGHQLLINKAKEIAQEKNIICGLMTFRPHPKQVICNSPDYDSLITPWETKQDILAELGVERVYIVEFNRSVAGLSPDDFIHKYLQEIQAQDLVVGDDFSYGAGGRGRANTLAEAGQTNGFGVTIIPSLMYADDVKVSSSLIRLFLQEARIGEINQLLDRPLEIRGKVIDGDKRGRELGFPTANLELTDAYLLPAKGVYAVRVEIANRPGETYHAVMNIGSKPTFNQDQEKISVEVHIFDFTGDIYGEVLSVHIIDHIRGERKFSSVDELIHSINNDITRAQQILKSENRGD